MAEKDAKVRLNLAASGFLTQLQGLRKASEDFEKAIGGIGDGAEKSSRKISIFGSAAKAGFGAAKGALSELGSSLKSAITMVATLGGALSVASSVRGAVELQRSYKDIAFGLEAGTGKAVAWQAVQRNVEGTANRWSQSNKDVSATFADMAVRMNDMGKASVATDKIAEFAAAGVGPMESLRRITASLTEQFAIKPEGLGQALAQTVSLSRAAGVSVEELDPKMAQLGATAKGMGFEGSAGLQKMLGMLVLAKGAGKNARQTFTEVTDLFTKLSDPGFLKDVGAKAHMHLEDHGTPKKHVLEMIIAHAGGKNEELAKAFSGPDLMLVEKFGAIYKKAADETKGDLKSKMTAGLAALDDAMKKAGQSNLDEAQVLKQAASNQQDAGAAFTKAMNTLEQAFTKPEMIKAIDEIAQKLPQLATAIAKMLGWALEHPKEAVALGVGAKVLPAVGTAVVSSMMGTAWKALRGGLGRAAVATGEAAAEVGGAAETGAAVVAGGGAAAVAGTVAAAVAAVGSVGLAVKGALDVADQLRTEVHGDGISEKRGSRGQRTGPSRSQWFWETSVAGGAMTGGRGGRSHAAQAKMLADYLNETVGTVASHGRGGRSAAAQLVADEATAERNIVSHGRGGRSAAAQKLMDLQQRLDGAAMASDRVGRSLDGLAGKLDQLGTPAGTNGLPPNPGDMSGSAPR